MLDVLAGKLSGQTKRRKGTVRNILKLVIVQGAQYDEPYLVQPTFFEGSWLRPDRQSRIRSPRSRIDPD